MSHHHAAHSHCGYGYPYYWYWTPYHAVPYGGSAPQLTCMKLPREIVADATATSKEAFIGGGENASLSLEYLKTGAAPTVKVSITDGGSTMVWSITTVPAEYQIKEHFTTVSPGATVKLDVVDCTARLRWCEIVSC